jgi:hypothetical protein
MTNTQHVTVNVHNPIVQQVQRLENSNSDTVVATLGNSKLHGSVDLFITENSWQAMRDTIDAFFASEKSEATEYLRQEIRAERISWGELAELQSLASHIDPGDVELLEWAGVPEKDEPYTCTYCHRVEDTCSADPCNGVLRDRVEK